MAEYADLMGKMVIDSEKVSNIIIGFIRKKVEGTKTNGVCLGLSGGVDSAVAAAIAALAVGPSNVHTLYLGDRDSAKKSKEHAQKIADWLKINFEIRDISEMMKEKGVYRPLLMRLGLFSPMNKLFIFLSKIIYPLIFRESPFVMNLKKGGSAKSKIGKIIYGLSAGAMESGFNSRHIQRRKIMEKYAAENNLLLIGAANRSEAFVGWFVKDGIDDLPIEVIMGLYKNQVRQLALFLGVPEEIARKKASPDMFRGVGDEDIIGYKYDKIDLVAYVIEHGLPRGLAMANGVIFKELEGIEIIHELSEWKRANKHEYPQVDTF